ncbi:MAG: hypothetical protein LBI44_07980 [Oscillospiraceae bacterium]|jgi:hypothetical protein|nr:hypothetical protein [Oscillospiraceae bacterium]
MPQNNVIFQKSGDENNSVFGKSLEPIRMLIERRAEAFEQKSAVGSLFKMGKSASFAEKITTMTSMEGFLPVGEGGEYPTDTMREGYSKVLEFETWKDRFIITRELVEDSKSIDLQHKPSAFTAGYYRAREKFAAALYAGAIAGAPASVGGKSFAVTGADGLPVFSGEHPSLYGGAAQSNRYACAFSADNLGKLETKMQNFRDERGNILALAPDTIVIPNDWQLKRDVFAAVGADKDPATANNGFNYTFGRYRIIVWPYLNAFLAPGAAPWIILDSEYNTQYGGAVWLDRIPLTVRSWVDNTCDNCVWNGRARFMAGFNDWRFAAAGGIPDGTEL